MAFTRNLHGTSEDGTALPLSPEEFGRAFDESRFEKVTAKRADGTPLVVATDHDLIPEDDRDLVDPAKKIAAAAIEAMGGAAFVHLAAGCGVDRGEADPKLKGKTIRTIQLTVTTYSDQ